MDGTDEARLVKQARSGSSDAAVALFRAHWPSVWKVAYAVLGSRTAADDAAQEAMLSAFSGLDGFDERRPLAPWLKRIAYNRAIDELRRRRRFTDAELNDFASGGTALAADLEEGARELEEAGGVAAAVGRLSPERRVIVVLHYWLDCTREEMAEILDLPIGTVASRLGRALSELRSRLEEEHV